MATPVAPSLSRTGFARNVQKLPWNDLEEVSNDRSSFGSVVPRAGKQENQVDTQ